MARWVRDEQLDQPPDFVQFIMEDYLNKSGFKKKVHKGQEVWQEGDGFLIIARFVRYEYVNGNLHLEAWVGKRRENPIKGFVGALPKKMFRESLEELIGVLRQPLPQGQVSPQGSVVRVQVTDHGKYAVPAMVLSIVGVVSALFLSALLGLLLGGVGITLGQKARNSTKANIANAAVILGIIALVIAIIGYVLNIFLAVFAFSMIIDLLK